MTKIILIKLGGSLITDKSTPYKANFQMMEEIAKQIKKALQKNHDLKIVLGNGAGSFAHQSAKKFGTIDGFVDLKGQIGACRVHHDAVKLNQIFTDILIKNNIPAFSYQPSAVVYAKNKKTYFNFEMIYKMIELNYIPVVYGDVILDEKNGSTIFSTDKIFRLLGEDMIKNKLDVEIIQIGNFPGVLDKNGQVIKKIAESNLQKILPMIGESKNTDVTGGMKHKIKEMSLLAKLGIKTLIINGAEKNSIFLALQGVYIGTEITS